MKQISRSSPVPLYYQIMESIRARIMNGELKPHDSIPPEQQLAEFFSVSRMTVRQAITHLVHEGLVYREHGRGTFVADPKISRRLAKLNSFFEDMKERGMEPGSRLLACSTVPAKPEIARLLRLEEGDTIIRLMRLRYADGVPMALQTTYLSFETCKEILEDPEFESLYRVLEEKCGVIPYIAQQTIESRLPDQREAALLGVDDGMPMLLIQRVSFTEDGVPFEVAHTLYRGDRFNLSLTLYRSPVAGPGSLSAGP